VEARRPESDLTPPEGRFATIDVLRGLSILWIVLFHLWSSVKYRLIGPPFPDVYYRRVGDRLGDGDAVAALTSLSDLVLRIGYHGVTLFMILSGVSLTMVSLRGGLRLRRYYTRRIVRLLLPYWAGLALLLVTLAALAAYRAPREDLPFATTFQNIIYREGRMPETPLPAGVCAEHPERLSCPGKPFKLVQVDRENVVNGLLIFPRGFSRSAALPTTLWFVLLMLQYYLVFPVLFLALQWLKPWRFIAAGACISVASTALLVHFAGDVNGLHSYIWSHWMPFRLVEFMAGMALGYALVCRQEALTVWLSSKRGVGALLVMSLAAHSLGTWFTGSDGTRSALSYTLLALGLTGITTLVIVATPRTIVATAPARLIAWIGIMSYAVLIANEPLRYIDFYLMFNRGLLWTAQWWFFIVAIYVPVTILLAYPLALVLGLLPGRSAHRAPLTTELPAVAASSPTEV
jgi:peptidoglycan/LPS O-acetylase OafA/YrhL